jgi:hypothetical protein
MTLIFDGDNNPIGFACGRKQQSSQPSLFASNARIELKAEGNMLVVISPWHEDYLNDFKNQIPYKSRKWDQSRKVWFVAPEFAKTVQDLLALYFGQTLEIPEIKQTAEKFEAVLKAIYVANCKPDTGFSNVFYNNGWNARIPETVLRTFFKNYSADNTGATYYATLGLDEQAKSEEIKSAYRRAARQWHPDVCREENAAEMFHKIKAAFDLLSNAQLKAQYDAGLFFERMSKGKITTHQANRPNSFSSYTPLLRCGYLQVTGHYEIGNVIVDEILAWEDITNERGQTMVSQWDQDKPSIIWV